MKKGGIYWLERSLRNSPSPKWRGAIIRREHWARRRSRRMYLRLIREGHTDAQARLFSDYSGAQSKEEASRG